MNDLCSICSILGFHDYKKFWMLSIFWRSWLLAKRFNKSCLLLDYENENSIYNQKTTKLLEVQ